VDALAGRRAALLLAVAIVLGLALAGRALGLDELAAPQRLARLRAWVDGFGALAPVVFVAGYVVAELLFVPALPLTLLGGLAFGPVAGTAYVSIGSTLAAAAAFLVARHLARRSIERWLAERPGLAAIDAAVTAHGWRVLVVTRLVPIFPFNLQNFAYGLTGIPFARYVLVSWACMLPGSVAYTLAGSALAEGGGVLLSLAPRWLARRRGLAGPLRDVSRG
jgi:uncharacterized membrane protein YdjX (TVP38/TMEM64 family)